MKTKFFILVVTISAVFFSCKKEAKAPATEVSELNRRFSVALDVTATRNDNFPVYFTEDKTSNFDPKNAIWSGVKGGNVQQTVKFELPEEVIPTNIRIDFGINKGEDRGDVTLERFKLNYYGKTFEAKGADFLKYFVKNDSTQTEIDEAKGTITFKKNAKSKIEPFYYPQQTILDEIKKLTSEGSK